MRDMRREVWTPDYDVSWHEMHGQEWPIVVVSKFETNALGERRYIDSRTYNFNAPRNAVHSGDVLAVTPR